MGFKHTPKIIHTPWANGTAENFMKTMGKLMQTASEEHLNWQRKPHVHKFLCAYRATPHPMTGEAPSTLFFNGRHYKTHLPTPTKTTILVFDREVIEQNKKQKQRMIEQNKKQKQRMKEYVDN